MMTIEVKKLTVKTIIAGGLFCALLFLVILPKAVRVKKMAADVRGTLAHNQQLQTSVLTAKHSGERLDQIKETLVQYKKKALYQEDLTRVLDEIGAAAQTAGLNVVSLRAMDEPHRIPGEPFVEGSLEIQQVMVSLQAEGKYPNMVQYFKALDYLAYSADVQTVTVKSADFVSAKEGEDPRLSADVMLAVLMRVSPIKKQT